MFVSLHHQTKAIGIMFGYGNAVNPKWSKQDSKNAEFVRLHKEIEKLQNDVDFINRISLKTTVSAETLANKKEFETKILELKKAKDLL